MLGKGGGSGREKREGGGEIGTKYNHFYMYTIIKQEKKHKESSYSLLPHLGNCHVAYMNTRDVYAHMAFCPETGFAT